MNSLSKSGHLCSIMALSHFMEATRDSGYKNTGSAISELVDNSIQAGANNIKITIEDDLSNEDIKISVLDNGCGMDPFTLRQALQFGGSSRFNDRNGIGRYGMGLPNSSFSQARNLSVYSWQHMGKKKNNIQCVYSTSLNFDEIINGDIEEIPTPRPEHEPPQYCAGKSGTLVIWSQCDKLDNRRPKTIANKIQEELGRRFRHYITNGVQITVNNEIVIPIDPLFLNTLAAQHGAKQYGKELIYEISTDTSNPDAKIGLIKIRFSELPVKRWRKLSNPKKREWRISKGAGVSILRAGREVDSGWFFMGSKRKENYDDWWRCEIEFDPILDEVFGITHTKQQIRPSEYISKILTPDLESIARKLNVRAQKAHKEAASDRSAPGKSESIANNREQLLPPLQAIANPKAKETMRQLRRKKLINNHSAVFEYKIIPDKLNNKPFFSYGFSKKIFALTTNQNHPFFREVSALKSTLSNNNFKHFEILIELLLLSAARSEASEKKLTDSRAIEAFRNRWSDTLATYINS